MTKTKLSITILIVMLTTISLSAEPAFQTDCCQPIPVGGMQVLEQNTFYPLLAVRDHLESDVVLKFWVDVNGNVSNIYVSESGGTMFDASAIEAVMTTKWNPAMQSGKAVAVNYELPFAYRSR
ncbi:MAG: energy transducer TonB [Candidatus Marinimicrobia bacterium]|nr:energy transducer TonB [Candidatus Neomarinimicrobiota bacterium]